MIRKITDCAVAYRVADCDALLVYEPDNRAQNDKRVGSLRNHWAQCTDRMLSERFTELMRERFPALINPPTFYECKSLGMAMHTAAGWPKSKSQQLAGHKKPSTTEGYVQGHDVFERVDLKSS
ncbi:MAG: hypothetical protein ACT4P0_11715 [Panacagrimonas sp.]